MGDFWNILYIAGIIETNVMFKELRKCCCMFACNSFIQND